MKPETTGTLIEVKQSEKGHGIKIKFQGKYITIHQLVDHPDLADMKLTVACVQTRYSRKRGQISIEELTKKARPKKPNSVTRVNRPKTDNIFSIFDHGSHKEKQEGEIFAGFITLNNFNNGNFWEFQRIGSIVKRKYDSPNYPWFLLESEIWERDWVIIREK